MSEPDRSDASDRPDWENRDDLSVGEILARTRRHYGLSLRDVEAALRIRAGQLEALEKNDYDSLPGRVYAIGFVRAYAEYLGLDGGRMVHLYKVQAGGGVRKPVLQIPAPASESKIPNLYVLVVSFLALVALIGAWVWLDVGAGARNSVHQVPGSEEAVIIDLHKTPLEEAVLAAVGTAAGGGRVADLLRPEGRIVLFAREPAWLEIRNNRREILLSRILKPGDSYIVPDEAGIEMDTGNIGALDFVVDGRTLPPLGAINEVRRNMSLNPDKLAAGADEQHRE